MHVWEVIDLLIVLHLLEETRDETLVSPENVPVLLIVIGLDESKHLSGFLNNSVLA